MDLIPFIPYNKSPVLPFFAKLLLCWSIYLYSMKPTRLSAFYINSVIISVLTIFTACQFNKAAQVTDPLPGGAENKAVPVSTAIAAAKGDAAGAAEIISRAQVPVLCYHQIRDWRPTDSKQARDYIVPVQAFEDQIKMLADSGYHTVSADQLYDYLNYGTALPAKPVMLTFDDTDLPQFTVAKPVMEKYGFKGLFFIMTVSLGRPNYMSREQVKQLADAGNEIGSHTWDHKNIKQFVPADWAVQIDKPTKTLEAITGKPVKYFAYPFGLWNHAVIAPLKEHGFRAAFQLAAKRDGEEPLYTIRRIIVPGAWSAGTLQSYIRHSF
jgi:peptidoglycan/xylan/chitin deacetylase (PgdA/CDA1 family)